MSLTSQCGEEKRKEGCERDLREPAEAECAKFQSGANNQKSNGTAVQAYSVETKKKKNRTKQKKRPGLFCH